MFSLKVCSPSVPPYVGFSPASGGVPKRLGKAPVQENRGFMVDCAESQEHSFSFDGFKVESPGVEGRTFIVEVGPIGGVPNRWNLNRFPFMIDYHLFNQPFIPVEATPWTMYFSAEKNTIITGIRETSEAAICGP